MPSILFIHQNYPAQFGQLAQYLATQGWEVMFATANKSFKQDEMRVIKGVRIFGYRANREADDKIHQYIRPIEKVAINGQGFARLAIKMQNSGISPDIIMAHSGWGSGSMAKIIWPKATYIQYLEWWYIYPPRDQLPGVVEKNPFDQHAKVLFRNLSFLTDAQTADAILVPTQFQAQDIPDWCALPQKVLHDGFDQDMFLPDRAKRVPIADAKIPDDAMVLTYATRGMEPYRGFPQFMAALEKVQQRLPNLHTVVAGTDTIHYGTQLPEGDSWKTRALAKHQYDLDRLHFVGRLPYDSYRDLLQRSNCHVYLTSPFVLSWSFIDAMAVGCPLVTNDAPPVLEAMQGQDCASVVDFQDVDQIADRIVWSLENQAQAYAKGDRAHAVALEHYAQSSIFPAKDAWLRSYLTSANLQS